MRRVWHRQPLARLLWFVTPRHRILFVDVSRLLQDDGSIKTIMYDFKKVSNVADIDVGTIIDVIVIVKASWHIRAAPPIERLLVAARHTHHCAPQNAAERLRCAGVDIP